MAIERREQVFVSSTYIDLVEERQEVIQTLLEADCIPAGMELFPASDDDRWTLIKRVIDDCDYYVVVVGGRYGSVDEDTGLSYTEMEFDYAVSQKKPVMGFLHGDPGSIAVNKSEMSEETADKLNEFRSKVEARMVKFWTNPSELGGQVAKSLIQIRKTHPAEGWVRASAALTPEREAEIAELRARVAELSSELESSRSGPRYPTEDLAQGDDMYELSLNVEYYTQTQVDEGIDYRSRKSRHSALGSISWNDLFSELGPLMIDDCTEIELDDRLDTVAFGLVRADTELLPADFGQNTAIKAAADVIHDVKIQLFSLGLIEQSDRRRAVTDSNTYWRLTSFGRDQLMRLRAIRREHSEGDLQESVSDGDELAASSGGPED